MAFTLVVEDGTGLANANSYCSLVDAQAYHDASLYNADWTAAASVTDKQKVALAMATRVIDKSCNFRGWRKSETQSLEWPRIRARNDDFYGQMPGRISALFANYFDDTKIPSYLSQATAHVAQDLIRTDRTLELGQKGIQSIDVAGAVRMVFKPEREGDWQQPLTEEAQRMLVKLVHSFRYGRGQVRVRRGQ